jgi:hypothetical protein
MPDQILLISPEEIVEIEARCSDCKNVAAYDVIGTQAGEGTTCPFCGAEWDIHKAAVAGLREGLKLARRVGGDLIRLRVRVGAPVVGLRKRD